MARSCCSRWASGPKLSHCPAVDSRNQRAARMPLDVVERAGQHPLHAAGLRVSEGLRTVPRPRRRSTSRSAATSARTTGFMAAGGAAWQRSAGSGPGTRRSWARGHRRTAATRSRSDGRHRKTSTPGQARGAPATAPGARSPCPPRTSARRRRGAAGGPAPGPASHAPTTSRAPGGRRASGRGGRGRGPGAGSPSRRCAPPWAGRDDVPGSSRAGRSGCSGRLMRPPPPAPSGSRSSPSAMSVCSAIQVANESRPRKADQVRGIGARARGTPSPRRRGGGRPCP